MPTRDEIESALAKVKDQRSFIDSLLRGALEWPIGGDARSIKDISYPWSKDDLRAADLSLSLVEEKVFQVMPFRDDQPWGIFILEFKSEEPFRTDRGMAGTLRKVLRGLVASRVRKADLPSWKLDNLLFICNHNYQDFRFASFRADPAQPRNPTAARIAAFGWGPNLPRRTACEFNLPPLAYREGASSAQWVEEWTDAFDVEKVTKKFYGEYAEVFEDLESKLKGPRDEEERRLAAQTLMNRLMFLRFVERKGWLQFGTDNSYLKNLAAAGGLPTTWRASHSTG